MNTDNLKEKPTEELEFFVYHLLALAKSHSARGDWKRLWEIDRKLDRIDKELARRSKKPAK